MTEKKAITYIVLIAAAVSENIFAFDRGSNGWRGSLTHIAQYKAPDSTSSSITPCISVVVFVCQCFSVEYINFRWDLHVLIGMNGLMCQYLTERMRRELTHQAFNAINTVAHMLVNRVIPKATSDKYPAGVTSIQ